MNAYSPLSSMKRLESAGLTRQHTGAIAFKIGDSTDDLVTDDNPSAKLGALAARLDTKVDAALDHQLVRIGVLLAALMTLTCSIVGLLVSIK